MVFPVIDGHVDLIYDMMRRAPGRPFSQLGEGHVTTSGLHRGSLRAIVSALFCPDSKNGPHAAAYLDSLFDYAARYVDGVPVIRTAGMLKDLWGGELSTGAVYLLENADAMVEVRAESLKRRGVAAVGLTHAGRNRLGDGNGVPAPEGLSSLGKRVLADITDAGLALDTAHLSLPCFFDVLEGVPGPIFSSHTGFRRFCDLPRNLSDEQVGLLKGRGAVIGVTVNPEMLRSDKTGSMEDVFEQVDWLVQAHGIEHAAIGSDFCGFDLVCTGLEDVGKLPALAERMLRAGYPEDAVGKVMGGNWERFYGEVVLRDSMTPEVDSQIIFRSDRGR